MTTQYERDEETGLDYRGARYYDSDIGRFLSLDSHAHDYPSLSDYCYVAGNPIILIDPDGKDPIPKEKFAEFKELLDNAQSITFTIFIDQPGEGGDRDNHEGTLVSGVDVGHTFVQLDVVMEDGRKKTITFGFYPKNSVSPLSPGTEGEIYDDTGHKNDVSYTFQTTESQAKSVLNFAYKVLDKNINYDLNTSNCTDFGLICAKKAGAKLKDTKGFWTGGGGSNPGDLGEDLRKRNKKRNKKSSKSKGKKDTTEDENKKVK